MRQSPDTDARRRVGIIYALANLNSCPTRASPRSAPILAQSLPDDPVSPGVRDAEWCDHLAHCDAWQPASGRLTVIAAHPDDEVLGAGGLIYAWAKRGLPITIVSVTDGEAANPERADLSVVRQQELRRALQALSAPTASVHRLGLPDGEIADHQPTLYKDLLHYAPAGTTLLAPFERDGQPDHDAVGRVCLEVARVRQVALARYPVWLWHQREPQTAPGLHWGVFGLSPQARASKARAIQCFESQLHPTLPDPMVPLHGLGYFSRSFEAFVL